MKIKASKLLWVNLYMTICLKHYIRDYVTKCNFLTYHVYFIHVFVFFMVLLSIGQPFFLFLFCNLFCMPIVTCLLFMLLLVGPKLTVIDPGLSMFSSIILANIFWIEFLRKFGDGCKSRVAKPHSWEQCWGF